MADQWKDQDTTRSQSEQVRGRAVNEDETDFEDAEDQDEDDIDDEEDSTF